MGGPRPELPYHSLVMTSSPPPARGTSGAPADNLATPYRTHTCGALRAGDVGSTVRLSGWVHRRRDHGQLIFLDLRDRHGISQVVIDRTDDPAAHVVASRVRSEFVVMVEGDVAARLAGTENPRLPTGAIEIRARSVTVLSEAKTPPFYINDPDAPIDEAVRLRYRYLDIRREAMAQRLLLRSRLVQAIREVHHAHGFVEVETPNLIKSTPEGARDFIVPSRLQPGSVYALPQSPQQLKQLLMVGGLDRYFQIARCFRDEDLRGDRQPEFTQLDLEMSFVDEDAVMAFVEAMVIEVCRATTPDRPIATTPFPRFTYDEAIERFGSAVEDSGAVRSPIAKFLRDDLAERLVAHAGAAPGDLVLVIADSASVTGDVLGRLRADLGTRLGLADPEVLSFCWINRFPMYQWDAENGRWDATHNPFSGVLPEDEQLLTTLSGDPSQPSPEDPAGRARALQYDIALNGWELGGGSIRIHRRELLARSFALQGQTDAAMTEKFGAVLEAFEYGAPPHGGIALGIDRWAALLSRQTNIREVMAFPKTQSGGDLMLDAPSPPDPAQYAELGLRFVGLADRTAAGDD